MKVIILTTSVYGTAGHHLRVLLESSKIEVAAVIVSNGQIDNKSKYYRRRLAKIIKIGVLGAWNGIRMRRWYNEDLDAISNIRSAEDICREQGIRFERVPSTNSEETQKLFKELNADIGLSLGNGYISKKVFGLPTYGMLNIHHEVLPQYQNAQSVIWQIYNGSSNTGYTIHKINSKIDGGDIVLQEVVPIRFKEDIGSTVSYTLNDLLNQSAEGLKMVLENFHHYYSNSFKQGAGQKYTTPSYWQYLTMLRQYKKLRKNVM